MGNQDKKLQGLLQDRFAGYEADPGVDLWPAIENEIHPGKKRLVVWWPYAAVAASVIILLGALYLFRNEVVSDNQPNFATEEQTETPFSPSESQPLETEVPPQTPSELAAAPATSEDTEQKVSAPTPRVVQVKSEPRIRQNSTPQSPEKSLSANNMLAEVSPQEIPAETNVLSQKLKPIDGNFSRVNSSIQTAQQPISEAALVSIRPPLPSEQKIEGERNALNLNKLSLEKAVAFASEEINKWTNGSRRDRSRKIKERSDEGKFRFAFAGLKVTKTRHNKDLNK
ncbi:MAG: hypothetical protein AAF206_27120 [Bacteroidota bacterium]